MSINGPDRRLLKAQRRLLRKTRFGLTLTSTKNRWCRAPKIEKRGSRRRQTAVEMQQVGVGLTKGSLGEARWDSSKCYPGSCYWNLQSCCEAVSMVVARADASR